MKSILLNHLRTSGYCICNTIKKQSEFGCVILAISKILMIDLIQRLQDYNKLLRSFVSSSSALPLRNKHWAAHVFILVLASLKENHSFMHDITDTYCYKSVCFSFVMVWQSYANLRWCPTYRHHPSEYPPSCPAATLQVLPSSTGEMVRKNFYYGNYCTRPDGAALD